MGVELLGQLVVHVEAINILPGGSQKRCEQRVDRALAGQLRQGQ